jgi:hypothetical protein
MIRNSESPAGCVRCVLSSSSGDFVVIVVTVIISYDGESLSETLLTVHGLCVCGLGGPLC